MSDVDLVETTAEGTLATTSLIIADGTGNDHASVLRLIRNNLTDFEDFGRVGFENRPFETAGGSQNRTVAVLNREHAMFAMTLFRNNEIVVGFKKRLIHAFVALEQRADVPALTGKALLAQAVIEAQSTITALEVENREQAAQIEQSAPKVEYHDDFVADDDLLTFSTVASNLGIKESRLRELLIDHKWIYKETRTHWSQKKQKKVPRYRYTECADKKTYFDRNLHHDVPRFGGQVMYTLMITPAGAAAVSRAVRKWLGGQGELEVISGGIA